MGVRQGASGTGEVSWVVVPSHSGTHSSKLQLSSQGSPSGSKGHSAVLHVRSPSKGTLK